MKFKKTFSILILVILLFNLFVAVIPVKTVLANDGGEDEQQTELKGKDLIIDKLKTTAFTNAKYAGGEEGQPDLIKSISKIVNMSLLFIGLLFFIFIIISGYQWLTATGNEEIIAKSKKRIINSTIGLAIVFSAYAITSFITKVIVKS